MAENGTREDREPFNFEKVKKTRISDLSHFLRRKSSVICHVDYHFTGHMFSQLYLELKWYRVLKAKSEIGRSVSQALQRIRLCLKYSTATRFCTGAYGEKVSEGCKKLSHKNISPSSLNGLFESNQMNFSDRNTQKTLELRNWPT
jgi:hypothetical protein